LLREREIESILRDYRRDPPDEADLRRLFLRLGTSPSDVLRRRARAFRELGLPGDEADEVLISHMATHRTLLELFDPPPDICAR